MQALSIDTYADIDYASYIKARDVPLADELQRRWPKVSRTMAAYLNKFNYETQK